MTTEHMVDGKVSQLIHTLLDRTREYKVKWERTVSKDLYAANIYPYTVTIRQIPPTFQTSVAYSLDMLMLEQGQTVELRTERNPGHGDYDMLKEIFTLIQTFPEYVEEGLDTLLQELENR